MMSSGYLTLGLEIKEIFYTENLPYKVGVWHLRDVLKVGKYHPEVRSIALLTLCNGIRSTEEIDEAVGEYGRFWCLYSL